MSKWYNTTYGFIMGIAAAALTISVVSATVAGIVIGSIALIVYTNSHTKANSCMRNTEIANNEMPEYKGKNVGLTLAQVNECRNDHGLSKLTVQQVKEGKKYPQFLDWAH